MREGRSRSSSGKGEARTLAALVAGVLVVVLIFTMFRSFGPDERGGGPSRTPQRPPPVAESPPVTTRSESARRAEPAAGAQPPNSAQVLTRAVLRCVDAESRAPLPGVRVYDQATDRIVAVADRQGRAELRDVQPGSLVLYASDYLATLLAEDARAALHRDGQAEASLWSDRYTIEVTVETRWPAGSEPGREASLELWLLPEGGAPEGAPMPEARLGPGASLEPEQRRAFEQHRLLAAQVPWPGLVWHLERQLLPHRLEAAGGRVRVVEARRYVARATGPNGTVARADIQVRARGPNRLELSFAPGLALDVRVRGGGGRPIEGARVVLQETALPPEQSRIEVTDTSGTARFHGLMRGDRLAGEVTAAMHEPARFELSLDRAEHQVVLRERPVRLHAITVREAGSGQPLAGVAVHVGDVSRPASQTTTDARGQATIRIELDEVRVLALVKSGYLDYREMLDETLSGGTLPQQFELVPRERERQLALKMIAVVEGELRDRDGKALPYETVALTSWVDAEGRPTGDSLPPPGMRPVSGTGPVRTVIAGQTPEPQVTATTDEHGRFELVSTAAGRAHAVWLRPQGEVRREVFLRLGSRQRVELR